MPTLDDHPLACIFPLMAEADLAALADDIAANGLRDPVWLYEGRILDGRNRYRACVRKGIDQRVEHYRGADPLGFVISKNLHRRHLTESQRAMVAANIAEALSRQLAGKSTGGRPTERAGEAVREAAAEMVNSSEQGVRRAMQVKAHGVPELAAAVVAGEVSVSAAAEVAKLPAAEQAAAVAGGPAAVQAAAKKKRASRKTPKTTPAEDAGTEDAGAGEHPADAFAGRVAELCRRLDGCKATAAELAGASPHGRHIHGESVTAQIEAARKALWQSRPTEACNCVRGAGPARPDCRACFGTGRTTPVRVLKGGR